MWRSYQIPAVLAILNCLAALAGLGEASEPWVIGLLMSIKCFCIAY